MTILGPKTGIPSLAAARLQRWAIVLSAYQYGIEFKRTEAHGNADGLSRLPLPAAGTGTDESTWLMWMSSTLRKSKHSR